MHTALDGRPWRLILKASSALTKFSSPVLDLCMTRLHHNSHLFVYLLKLNVLQCQKFYHHTMTDFVKISHTGKCIYIAHFMLYLTLKALRHGSHSVTCNYTNACFYLVSVHQMAHPQTEVVDIYLHPATHLSIPERMKGCVGLVS